MDGPGPATHGCLVLIEIHSDGEQRSTSTLRCPESEQKENIIRVATRADVDSAADILTSAFVDYPFTRHTIAADDHLIRLREFQRIFLQEIAIPFGRVWLSDDDLAVSVWTTPQTAVANDIFDEVGPRLTELAGDRAAAWRASESMMAEHRPTEPVWFLGAVAVQPSGQGRGLGRAIIEPGLAAADVEMVPAFLETSTQANVRLYERLGFVTIAEYDLPGGGPHTWSMLRPPTAEPAKHSDSAGR